MPGTLQVVDVRKYEWLIYDVYYYITFNLTPILYYLWVSIAPRFLLKYFSFYGFYIQLLQNKVLSQLSVQVLTYDLLKLEKPRKLLFLSNIVSKLQTIHIRETEEPCELLFCFNNLKRLQQLAFVLQLDTVYTLVNFY